MRFSGLFWNATGVSNEEELPGIVLAVYVGNDKGGRGKAWSGTKQGFGDYHHNLCSGGCVEINYGQQSILFQYCVKHRF